MARSLSAVAKEAIFSQETAEEFIPLLLINHEDLTEPVRLANSRSNVITNDALGTDVTYLGYPFQIQLPDETQDKFPEVAIILDNVDRRLVDIVRTYVRGTPTITLSIVLASSPKVVEAGPFKFSLRSVSWDKLIIRGVLSYEQLLDEVYPYGTFNPSEFPGIFR